MPSAALVVTGVALPVAYLAYYATQASWAEAGQILAGLELPALLANTAMLALGVLVSTLAIALPLAWLVTRSDLPGRGIITTLGVLPLAIPGYVMAYALLGAAGQRGVVAQLTPLTLPPPTETYWGAMLALSLYTFPYLFLNLRSALLGLDPALEEQARSLGHGPWSVFFRVTLPQLRPALQAGGLLVALHSLNDFGVVSLMRYETFSWQLYDLKQAIFLTSPKIKMAFVALVMLALTLGLVILEARLLRNLLFHRIGTGTPRQAAPVKLGRWCAPAYGFVGLVALLAVVLPLGVIGYWMARNPALGKVWADLGSALVDSLSAAAPAALLGAVLAYPLVHLSVRRPSMKTRALERIGYFGYAAPPLVLGLVITWFPLDGARLFAAGADAARDAWPAVIATPTAGILTASEWLLVQLHHSLTILVLAYAVHFMAEAIGPIRSALYQVPPRLEETARSLNCGPARTFLTVTLPLVRRGVFVALALVFLSAMKELPLMFWLEPPGFHTLAFNVWDHTNNLNFASAAPYALTLTAISSLFVIVLLRYGRQ
jgi:iron(III) transport system permease protein